MINLQSSVIYTSTHTHTRAYAHKCTLADRYVPLTSHWPLYEVINLLKRLGSFYMASVAGSRQDSKRVHVHLMAHERTMATALAASQAQAALWAELRLQSMAGRSESMAGYHTAVKYSSILATIFWVRYRFSLNQPADQSSRAGDGWKKWVWMEAFVYSSFRTLFFFVDEFDLTALSLTNH